MEADANGDQLARALGGKTIRELIDLRDKELREKEVESMRTLELLGCKLRLQIDDQLVSSSIKKMKKPTRVVKKPLTSGLRVKPPREQASYRLYLRQPKLGDLLQLSPQLVLSLLTVILILPCSCQLLGSKNIQATSNQQSDVILSTGK